MAAVINDLYAGICGTSQCLPELRLSIIVREDHMDPIHLDDKGDFAEVTLTGCCRQFIQMFHAARRVPSGRPETDRFPVLNL